MKFPRQWILITAYMALVYCVILGLMHYAKTHPLEETPQASHGAP